MFSKLYCWKTSKTDDECVLEEPAVTEEPIKTTDDECVLEESEKTEESINKERNVLSVNNAYGTKKLACTTATNIEGKGNVCGEKIKLACTNITIHNYHLPPGSQMIPSELKDVSTRNVETQRQIEMAEAKMEETKQKYIKQKDQTENMLKEKFNYEEEANLAVRPYSLSRKKTVGDKLYKNWLSTKTV